MSSVDKDFITVTRDQIMLCKRRISIPHKNDIGLTKKKIKLNQTNKTTKNPSHKNKKIKVFSNFFVCLELQVYLAV